MANRRERKDRRNNGGAIVLSLGGSLIVPKEGEIALEFLKTFAKLILEFRIRWRKVILVAGGGRTARMYIEAAQRILHEFDREASHTDCDWIGIHATRANGHLLRTIFLELMPEDTFAHVLKNPEPREGEAKRVLREATRGPHRIVIAAGWKPGRTTDEIAVRMARAFGAKTVVNLTDVPYVYDRNPKLDGAQELREVAWGDYLHLFPSAQHRPGDHSPFDPRAARLAAHHGMRVIVFRGNVQNITRFLRGGPYADRFQGSVIGGRARQGNGAVAPAA